MTKRNEYNLFLVKQAKKYGIKARFMDESGEFVELSKAKKTAIFWGGVIANKTSALALSLCKNKYYTQRFLKHSQYPVLPMAKASIFKEAVEFLIKHKAVVVKPLSQKQGKGITVNVETKKELKIAWNYARKYGKSVLIEKYFSGEDIRILVVGYNKLFIIKRLPAFVVGNGKDRIEVLIAKHNQGIKPSQRLKQIIIDQALKEFLSKNKKSLDYIPKDNEKVILRGTANLHTGGQTEEYSTKIPLIIKQEVKKLAKELHCPVLGVDYLISRDTKKRYIIELNPDAGVQMHHRPIVGKAKDPTREILKLYFKNIK